MNFRTLSFISREEDSPMIEDGFKQDKINSKLQGETLKDRQVE